MSDRLHRQRSEYAIIPAQAAKLKIRMLDWAQQFSIHLFLDNNQYQSPYKGYECLLAAGAACLLMLALGATWLAVSVHLTVSQAILLGVAPFLPGEALKVAAAAGAAQGWRRIRRAGR